MGWEDKKLENNSKEEECYSCCFWRPHNNTWGACKRFPPNRPKIDNPMETLHPLVKSTNWCGEYDEK